MKKATKKGRKFTCAICKETFNQGWTDEEALQEKKELGWDDVPMDNCMEVCDDCFKKYEKQRKSELSNPITMLNESIKKHKGKGYSGSIVQFEQ
jgi:hypothetical protein